MKRTIAVLVVGSLSMTDGFSSWHSKNYRKPSIVGETHDVKSTLKMHNEVPESARKTLSTIAKDTTKSAMVALVVTTLAAGSYLSPLPAFAQDGNAPIASIESTSGASSLLWTSPPSAISSIDTFSLVIANADEEPTSGPVTSHSYEEEEKDLLAAMESAAEVEAEVTDTTSSSRSTNVVVNQEEEAEIMAGSARERAKSDPPGETYLLVEASKAESDATVVNQEEAEIVAGSARERAKSDPPGETYLLVEASNEESDATVVNQEEAEIVAGSARERAKSDPPGETYLLVQTSPKESTEEGSIEEPSLVASVSDTTIEVEAVEEELSTAANELIAEATIEDPQEEESLVAVADSNESEDSKIMSSEVEDPVKEDPVTVIASEPDVPPQTEDEGSSTLLASVEEAPAPEE